MGEKEREIAKKRLKIISFLISIKISRQGMLLVLQGQLSSSKIARIIKRFLFMQKQEKSKRSAKQCICREISPHLSKEHL